MDPYLAVAGNNHHRKEKNCSRAIETGAIG